MTLAQSINNIFSLILKAKCSCFNTISKSTLLFPSNEAWIISGEVYFQYNGRIQFINAVKLPICNLERAKNKKMGGRFYINYLLQLQVAMLISGFFLWRCW